MQRQKSVLSQMVLVLFILTALLVAVLSVFAVSFYLVVEKDIKNSAESVLHVYVGNMKNSINQMNRTLMDLSTRSEDLSKIKSKNETERNLASISLHNYMVGVMYLEENADAYIVFDKDFGICLDVVNQHVSFSDKTGLRNYVAQALTMSRDKNYKWNFAYIDGKTYLCRILSWEDRVLAVFMDTANLMKNVDKRDSYTIAISDEDGNIAKTWGKLGDDAAQITRIDDIYKQGYYYSQTPVVEGQLELYVFYRLAFSYSGTGYGLAAVGILAGIAVIYMLFVVRFVRRSVVYPMQSIIGDMEEIGSGAFDKRVEGDFSSREFGVLKDTTNQMLNEILHLKISGYETKIALRDMELNSIRLQIKPHFFLNALTTISSLSARRQSDQVVAYIMALSKNVRYMFRAGFHTVPLKDEIWNLENYFEMQELKYPDCVFHIIDMQDSLSEWRIPQMLLHTFIENEYKYAASLDSVLTILIKIRSAEHDGEPMLLVEIEDDGPGYSEDVLLYISGKQKKTGNRSERVGLWSIKKMLELMYERDDLLHISNIEPHGCLNRIFIPEKPIHELTEKAGE